MDIQKLMSAAQAMQSRLQEVQREVQEGEYAGEAGGGMVTATVNGRKELVRLAIEPTLLKPEEARLVQDLIVSAVAAAQEKADAAMKEALSKITGGLPFGAGMFGGS